MARNAYVLTRIYNDYSAESNFKERFKAAAKSLSDNAKTYRDGKVYWMLLDDSPEGDLYDTHWKALLDQCAEAGFSSKKENLCYIRSAQPGNSAYASFQIREAFLSRTEEDSSAFAVLLDQDDELKKNAIKHIARKMTEKGVILLPFSVEDDGGKDNTGDGGKTQRKLARAICLCKRSGLKRICYASSMGWSKAYSRHAFEQYHKSLKGFLGDAGEYFKEHPAYEDFVDFYVLLRKDITVSATTHKTHIYHKHSESITGNPDIDAFRLHRTANLLTLIDMCYAHHGELRDDFEQLLLRYITVKVVDIERILAGYRKDFDNGNMAYSAFAENTQEGYFINELYRLAQGEYRGETQANFNALFSCDNVNSIKVYHADLKHADSRHVLQKAYQEENKFRTEKALIQDFLFFIAFGCVFWLTFMGKQIKECVTKWWKKKIWKSKEKPKRINYDDKRTPNQKRYVLMWVLLILWFFVIVGFGLWAFDFKNNRFNTDTYNSPVLALMATVLAFLLNELSKVHVLAKEEVSKKKLYFSEFEDLIRHLEANLKVMIEIRKSLSEGKIPAGIHFINLSWPETSCLLSDDISKILDKKKVDDFARLKVNLRNIQNSSKWLSTYMLRPHTNEEIGEAIDWEIARHMGYLMNFHYLQNNQFQFPSQGELEYYIHEKHLKQYLTGLFMSYHGEGDRLTKVEEYLNLYFKDRRECRSVLFYSAPAGKTRQFPGARQQRGNALI